MALVAAREALAQAGLLDTADFARVAGESRTSDCGERSRAVP
jgi:hypothetical protein